VFSYICDFNLRVSGREAEGYITRILREWPPLYDELPGVRGTLLLANAFALAGEYSYRWRVDLDSFETLQRIDDALKSEEQRWRKARAEWFETRAAVRARLLSHDSGAKEYCRERLPDREGLIHYILTYGTGGGGYKHPSSAN